MSNRCKCIAAHILTHKDLIEDKDLIDVKYKRYGKIFEQDLYFNIKSDKQVNRLLYLARRESSYIRSICKVDTLVLVFYSPSKYVDLLTLLSNEKYPAYNNKLVL